MSNRLMISVAAAALIAGTGFANAQGTGMSREAPAAAAPAQQSAPAAEHGASDRATSGGEMNRDAAKPGMKSTQSEQKSPAAGTNQRADEGMQGQKSQGQKSTTVGSDEKADQKSKMSSDTDNKGGKDMKAEGQNRNGNMNADSKSGSDNKGGKDMKAEGRQDNKGNMNADSKGGSDNKTVGQAGAGAKLSTEQRTKITTVIKDQHIAPVTNVNFSISVGTRVPRDVSFHPLPAEIVTVYPDWRGYEFILVRDQIVVIDPASLEIVAVIDA